MPGSREAVEAAVRSITKTFDSVKYPGQAMKFNEWLSKMPRSDNVYDHIRLNGLFVPFEKRLFGDSLIRTIDPCKSPVDAQLNEGPNIKLLPTVRSTDSVLWAGRDDNEAQPCKYARVEVESGQPAQDCRPNAASRRAMERERKKCEVSNIRVGDKIFINLSAWPEYEDEWPYDSPKASTYVVGVYGKAFMKRKKELRELHVPAFEWNYEVGNQWIQDFGLVYELPNQGEPNLIYLILVIMPLRYSSNCRDVCTRRVKAVIITSSSFSKVKKCLLFHKPMTLSKCDVYKIKSLNDSLGEYPNFREMLRH